jgi:16S rRNA (guanine(966)-N(2))-methyltransferase RsmD
LGFEAASRGAERVTLVEKNPLVYRALQDNIKKLALSNISLRCQDGLEFAARDTQRYDVIFLDPPFDSDFLPKLFDLLAQRLSDDGLLYVETGGAINVPEAWQVVKSGKAGQVHYQLLKVQI